MAMNPTIKQQWIDKLRDGTVQQAVSTLEDSTGAMCCLGVLMLVQGKSPVEYFETLEYDIISNELMTSTIPQQFAAGLEQCEMGRLAAMNDGGLYRSIDGTAQEFQKHTFAEIADYIEQNL